MRESTRKRKEAERQAEAAALRLKGAHGDLEHAIESGADEQTIQAIEDDIEKLKEAWEEWEDDASYWMYQEQYGETWV